MAMRIAPAARPVARLTIKRSRTVTDPKPFMRRAIALSRQNLETMAGGPFGSVVVKDGQIVARAATTC